MSRSRKTILLVEDEAIIALAEKQQLEAGGYGVKIVTSGAGAIAAVNTAPGAIDLILMDINLGPGMDGVEAAAKILENHDIPVVFLSSHREKPIVEKTERVTSYGYIVKQTGETVLLTSVKMAFKLFESNARLRDSEARYRRLVENSPDVVYTFSSKRGGVYYSPSIEKVLGYPIQYLYAHPLLWNESIHASDRPRILQVIEDFGRGIPFDIEYRIQDAHGEWRWLRDRSIGRHQIGDEVLIEGLVTDITERKQNEDLLRQAKEDAQALISTAPDAIFLADIGTGVILAVNDAACRLMDRPREDLVGLHQSALHPPVNEAFSTQTFNRHVQESRADGLTSPIETSILRLDGSLVPVEVLAQVAQIDGRPVLMGVFRDISRRKADEARIKNLLEEKELLLREVHHRVKNNMNTIFSLLSIQAESQTNPVVHDVLEGVMARLQSMMTLYDKLNESKTYTAIPLQGYFPALLEGVIGLFPNGRQITLKVEIEEIYLTPKLVVPLGMIVNELATNSMKHAFGADGEGTISLRLARCDGLICMQYQDDGPGLAPEFNLKNSTGLGTQLIKLLAVQLGGTIQAKNDHGAVFSLEFSAP